MDRNNRILLTAASEHRGIKPVPLRKKLDAMYTAGSSSQIIALQKRTSHYGEKGLAYIDHPQLVARACEMVLWETGLDLRVIDEKTVLPEMLSEEVRVGLQPLIDGAYFGDVACKVSLEALVSAVTVAKFFEALWRGIPSRRRISRNAQGSN